MSKPWEHSDGSCLACNAPQAAVHYTGCYLADFADYLRNRWEVEHGRTVSESANGTEHPYQRCVRHVWSAVFHTFSTTDPCVQPSLYTLVVAITCDDCGEVRLVEKDRSVDG